MTEKHYCPTRQTGTLRPLPSPVLQACSTPVEAPLGHPLRRRDVLPTPAMALLARLRLPDRRGLQPAASRRRSRRAVRRVWLSPPFGPLPVSCRSDRIMTDGTAGCPQVVQVQAYADSQTGAGVGRVLGACRSLYNTALEQRITAYQRRRVSVSRFEQEAELKAIRAEFPEYAAIHSHVLQDVLARLDKTYQAFFRRLTAGEKAGFPRYQARDRYHSFHPNKSTGMGPAGEWTAVPRTGPPRRGPHGGCAQDRHDLQRSGLGTMSASHVRMCQFNHFP